MLSPVYQVIDELGLPQAKDTLIGNQMVRGVSGEQEGRILMLGDAGTNIVELVMID